jgi:hypothetical protein
LKVPDDATKERVDTILHLHRTVTEYVRDVWHIMTGQRAPMQTGTLSLDQYVTSLFKDHALVQRIVTIQESRTAAGESRMTPEENASTGAYKHLRRHMAAVPQDADFQLVAQELGAHFAPVRAVGDLRVDLTESDGLFSRLFSSLPDKPRRDK